MTSPQTSAYQMMVNTDKPHEIENMRKLLSHMEPGDTRDMLDSICEN